MFCISNIKIDNKSYYLNYKIQNTFMCFAKIRNTKYNCITNTVFKIKVSSPANIN